MGGSAVRVANESLVDDGFRAVTSLSRALEGGVQLTDVGSLLWVVLRQMVPCDAMALFMPDRAGTHAVIRYAAGAHAAKLLGIRRPLASGIAAWVAINRRSILNAEPIFDLGVLASSSPALRSSVVVPLVDNGAGVAVLALYSKDLLAFTDEQASMLELLGPRVAIALADAALSQVEPAVEPLPALRLAQQPPA